jgi:hypothetical protein
MSAASNPSARQLDASMQFMTTRLCSTRGKDLHITGSTIGIFGVHAFLGVLASIFHRIRGVLGSFIQCFTGIFRGPIVGLAANEPENGYDCYQDCVSARHAYLLVISRCATLDRRTSPATNEHHNCENQTNDKQDPRYVCRGSGNTAKTEYAGDQCNDQERNCPTYHF